MQVKPLLQVTNTEEKINQKETELKQVVDKFDKLRLDHDDLEKKHQQILDEKVALTDQLQAEVELCNEAEEVTTLLHAVCGLSVCCLSVCCMDLTW